MRPLASTTHPVSFSAILFAALVASSSPSLARDEPQSPSVPLVGRPETFTGAVGHFRISAEAHPRALHVGDPLTLTLRIEGDGPLAAVGPPNLAAQPKLQAWFAVQDAAAPAVIDGNTKLFTVRLRPKTADARYVSPIRFAYFNPTTHRFETVATDALPLSVTEPRALTAADLPSATAQLPEHETPPVRPSTPPFNIRAIWLAGAALFPLVGFGLWAGRRLWTRRQRATAAPRRRHAASHAHRRLAVLDAGNPAQAAREIARTVTTYVADRLDLPHASQTSTDVCDALRAAAVQASLVDETRRLLTLCDRARFAGPRRTADDAPHLLPVARKLIDALHDETLLRPSRSAGRG